MSGAAGIGAGGWGMSATRDSVVRTMEATEAAFSRAERQTVTEDVPNALVLNSLPLFGAFEEPVYLGFAGNTPRKEACLKYLAYLLSAPAHEK